MSQHPLTLPLTSFHSKFVSILDELPKDARALEITKRVIIAAAAIFAYLVFGCLYLVGRFDEMFLRRANGDNGDNGDKPRECVNISEKMVELKQSVLQEITTAKRVDAILCAKIFFNLKVDGNLFSKDYVIIKKDESAFDNKFLTEKVESIINELGELMKKETGEKFEFIWDAIIEDTSVTFARAWGSAFEGSTTGFSGSNWRNIPAESLENIFNFVLNKMGREIKPQFNNRFKFV